MPGDQSGRYIPNDTVLDKVMVTEDEGTSVPWKVGQWVEAHIAALGIDSYNEQYVVRLTVTKLNTPVPQLPEDEDSGG
jgi:hypothetical protein